MHKQRQFPLFQSILNLPIYRLNPIPPPPSPNPPINLLPSESIPHNAKRDPQLRLDIAIARLIVKKQHILKRDPAALVNLCKMLRFVPGKDLHEVKVVEGAVRLCFRRGRLVGEAGDDV